MGRFECVLMYSVLSLAVGEVCLLCKGSIFPFSLIFSLYHSVCLLCFFLSSSLNSYLIGLFGEKMVSPVK